MYTDFLWVFFFSFLSSEYQLDALSAQFSIVAIDLRLFMTQRVFLEVSHVLAYLVTLQDSPGGTITQSSLLTKKPTKFVYCWSEAMPSSQRWWNHVLMICPSICCTDTSQSFLEQLPLVLFLLAPKLFELHLFLSQISPKLFFISRLMPRVATVPTDT